MTGCRRSRWASIFCGLLAESYKFLAAGTYQLRPYGVECRIDDGLDPMERNPLRCLNLVWLGTRPLTLAG